jgi:hypothetical protein
MNIYNLKENKKIKFILRFLLLFLIIWGCEEFFRRKIGGFAGSYPFVEYWDIKATESEVIFAIKELKQEDISLQPPGDTILVQERNTEYDWDSKEMIDFSAKLEIDSLTPFPKKTKKNTKDGYWLYINFYYSETGEIVKTWLRPDFDSTITTLAFVGLNRKLINRDYWFLDNQKEIKKFKKRIVEKIQNKVDKLKNK